MIEIIKELNIEVSKPNVFQAIVAKQYDMNTRFIKATFVDGGDKIFLDPNATVSVVINALRPDGKSKGFDGVVNDDGTVTVPLHSWMLELVGTVICDISVIDTATDDNKKLTTTSFTLIVEKAAYGGDDITSDPQYDVLVTLVETCNEASTVAQEALEKSNTALEKSTEADSKYAACVEATENANKVREEIEAGGYIESLKEMNNGGKFSVWIGTTEEYNNILNKIPNCLYILTDEVSTTEILDLIEEIRQVVETQASDIETNTTDIETNTANIKKINDDFLNKTYPVGSMYISHNRNVNPATKVGGTWTLIDKEFKPLFVYRDNYNLTTYVSEYPLNSDVDLKKTVIVRQGHCLQIQLDFSYNPSEKADYVDSQDLVFAVLNYTELGIDRLASVVYETTFSDGANTILGWKLAAVEQTDSDGNVTDQPGWLRLIEVNPNSIPADTVLHFKTILNIPSDYMLDGACNKFYWQRTA